MIKWHFFKSSFPNFCILYSTQNAIKKINMWNHERIRKITFVYNQLWGVRGNKKTEKKTKRKRKTNEFCPMRICSRRPVGTVASALHYTLTAPLEYDVMPPDKLVDARRRSPGSRKPSPPKKKIIIIASIHIATTTLWFTPSP